MKKIILLVLITLMLTSCGEDNTVEVKIEENTSFSTPKNDLEQEINSRELNLNKSNKAELIDLAKSYLAYGDAYYKEEAFANKALEILNNMESEFIVEYLKGYAYEIQAKYDKALIQYDKVLAFENIKKEEKINALNQKGHVFDLNGDIEKANTYYKEAEDLDSEYITTLVNRGRYEIRKLNDNLAKTYFEKVLEKTKVKHLKSEMYYNLSIIAQNDIKLDKAIEYAQKGIENDKDYPGNYLSLGVSYITKGGEDTDKAIKFLDKSVELYENNSMAYKYLGIYYYTKDEFDKAIDNFSKQVIASKKDILLMFNKKIDLEASGEYDLARSYAMKGDAEKSLLHLRKAFDLDGVTYYSGFMIEYLAQDGPFIKVQNDDNINEEFKNIILKYNK